MARTRPWLRKRAEHSPELVALARQRQDVGARADLKVASAYDTGLPDGSIDVIFCIALIHHLDIAAVRTEMRRILAKDGLIIVSEPIGLSHGYNRIRALLPSRETISDHEHPLTRDEFAALTESFQVEGARLLSPSTAAAGGFGSACPRRRWARTLENRPLDFAELQSSAKVRDCDYAVAQRPSLGLRFPGDASQIPGSRKKFI